MNHFHLPESEPILMAPWWCIIIIFGKVNFGIVCFGHGYTGGKVNMIAGKTVVYHLYITDTMVNYTGKSRHAYAINGTIPGPDLVFTEGDTAEIYLHNMLKDEETSLNWHGVILPNRFDGVPYLTTAPIHPGDVHLYKFAIVQNGTYWYHSHSELQEQAGIYGALIFNKRQGQNILTKQMLPSNNMNGQERHNMMDMDMEQKEMPHQKDTRSKQENHKNMPQQDIKNRNPRGMNHSGDDNSTMDMTAIGNGSFNAEQTVV